VKAVLIGGTGYGGAELLRRLLFHPQVEVTRVTAADNIGKKVGDVHSTSPESPASCSKQVPAAEASKGAEVVFLALPHKTTAKVVLEMLDAGYAGRIVDMSGDFRLRDAAAYEKFYGVAHPAPVDAHRRRVRLRPARAEPRRAACREVGRHRPAARHTSRLGSLRSPGRAC